MMVSGTPHLVVVGGGHAGIEAAHIAARLGIHTTLLSMHLDLIGQMSCNPSIGGVGKGHMVRELDALGGLQAQLIDATGIHFRILNESRGLAVRGPRAQADKILYRMESRKRLEAMPTLRLRHGIASEIVWSKGTTDLQGLRLLDGSFLPCQAIIITAGTFLNGHILFGEIKIPAGRAGEPPSTHLADQLRALGLRWRRLKTGTSPRIDMDTIDFSQLQIQLPDDPPRPFSFFSQGIDRPQVPCHLVQTTPATEAVIRSNLHRSAMYGGHVEGMGPRYCPSIEDKYVKFPHKEFHQIFVEPESLLTREIYLAGLNTSMPVDVQLEMVRSMPGFTQAEILRPGYAIEYDAFDPLQLDRSLAVTDFDGLWLAGQINGTTGYEEAAGQGLIAGINAARALQGKSPIVLERHQAYIGVMIDDLVTKGVDEPYRMLTARAEHRLSLACDLADERLLPVSREIGALRAEQLDQVEARLERRHRLRKAAEALRVKTNSSLAPIAEAAGISLDRGWSLTEFFQKQQLSDSQIDLCLREIPGWHESMPGWDPQLERELFVFEIRYAAYRDREAKLLAGHRSWDAIRIPSNFLEEDRPGFSLEVRQKLRKHRPETLGQASRIPGLTHAALTLLHMLIEKENKA